MKKFIKMLLALVIAWVGIFMIHSADFVEAKSVTISTDKKSIKMNNAGLQASCKMEFYVNDAPEGATVVVTLGNSKVARFYSKNGENNKIKLYNKETYKVNSSDGDYEEDEEDDEGFCFAIMPLTVGQSSVIINVYSSNNDVLATKTIPVTVKKVTPQLYQYNDKTKRLASTSQWNCECGDWVSGSFGLKNIPYGSKVTLSVNKKNMYKYINVDESERAYKWKSMKKNSYVMKADPYCYEDCNYRFNLYPIKSGNAKITITIESGDVKTTFVVKNKVISYQNPLENLVINGRNKTKAYNRVQYLRVGTNLESSTSLDMYNTESEKVTGQIKMKKGYKLVSVKKGKTKIKLTKKNGIYYFSVKKPKLWEEFKIIYKDKKGKTRCLCNCEV